MNKSINSSWAKIIYIHGFNSSASAYKAQLVKNYLAEQEIEAQFLALDLPALPAEAMAALQQQIEAQINQLGEQKVFLIGSSLGGYYGTYFAEKYGVRLVLINPSVHPYRSLKRFLGPNHNPHSGEHYVLREEHADGLRQFEVEVISQPQNFLLMVQSADETLDYRQAVLKYSASPQRIELGGSHGFDGFEQRLAEIMSFFDLA